MNLIEFHFIGGLPWMLLLSLVLIINIILIVRFALQKSANPKLQDLIKQLGGFALAFGAFSTLVALFQAFRDISKSAELIPGQVIFGGLQVALITVLYGFGIFVFTQAALIGFGVLKKTNP